MKIVIIFAILFTSCSYVNKTMGWKDQNPIERLAEDAIQISSGQIVDLSAVKSTDVPK